MKEMHYFISLEQELENSFNYIEPENDNLKCYGAKYVSLLNSVCIEFESLSKILIKHHRPKTHTRQLKALPLKRKPTIAFPLGTANIVIDAYAGVLP